MVDQVTLKRTVGYFVVYSMVDNHLQENIMTTYQFERTLDRQSSLSMKWNPDQLEEYFGNRDALPFWVADMDFPSPPAVIKH